MRETLVRYLGQEDPLEKGYTTHKVSLVAQFLKNLPPMQETWVQSLGWEDPLEKGKATHSSLLAWRIPWTVHGVTKSQTGTQLSDFHVPKDVRGCRIHFSSFDPFSKICKCTEAGFLSSLSSR